MITAAVGQTALRGAAVKLRDTSGRVSGSGMAFGTMLVHDRRSLWCSSVWGDRRRAASVGVADW